MRVTLRPMIKPASNEMSVIFVNGSSNPFVFGEIDLVYWSREVVLFVLAFTILYTAVPHFDMLDDPTLWWRLALAPLHGLGFVILFPALLAHAATLLETFGAKRIFEPAVSLASATLLGCLMFVLEAVVLGLAPATSGQLLKYVLSDILFWQVVSALVFLFVHPAIKDRAGNGTVASSGTNHLTKSPALRLGRYEVQPDQVRHIASEDHYLLIHVAGDRLKTVAKLKDAEEALSPFGMVVHRSHWVAYDQFVGVAREGRRFVLSTKDVGAIPVSRARHAEVVAALTAHHGVLT